MNIDPPTIRHRWRGLATRGAISVVLGTLAMVWTDLTITVFVVVFGICAIADGVLALRAAARGTTPARRWSTLVGLVSIALGCATVVWPSITALGLAVLIGVWLTVSGVDDIVTSVHSPRGSPGRGTLAVGGAVGLLGGLYLVVSADRGALAVVYVIGLIAVVRGAGAIAAALASRHEAEAVGELAPVPMS